MSEFKRQAKCFIKLYEFTRWDAFTHFAKSPTSFAACGVDEGTASPRIAEVTCGECLTQTLQAKDAASLKVFQKMKPAELRAAALTFASFAATDKNELYFGVLLALLYERLRVGSKAWTPADFDDFCRDIP